MCILIGTVSQARDVAHGPHVVYDVLHSVYLSNVLYKSLYKPLIFDQVFLKDFLTVDKTLVLMSCM